MHMHKKFGKIWKSNRDDDDGQQERGGGLSTLYFDIIIEQVVDTRPKLFSTKIPSLALAILFRISPSFYSTLYETIH